MLPHHYSFLMSQKSSCFAAAWDLAPCPHSQCLFRYVLLMPTKFSCLAAAWDLAPCPHFHYLPNDLLHHQAGDRKGKVSNFRWLRDRKIGCGILSSSGIYIALQHRHLGLPGALLLRIPLLIFLSRSHLKFDTLPFLSPAWWCNKSLGR